MPEELERGKEQPPDKPDAEEQRDRERWFFASRADGEGKPLRGLFARASAQHIRAEKHLHASLLQRPQKNALPPPAPPGPAGSVNWTPIGPSVVAHGQASGNPPVSGRINAMAVGPGGNRVYVGAANGGVWFSADGGTTWSPMDDYAVSPTFTSGLEADSLSVGALAVKFGASAATDQVFVGTGEPGAGDGYFGVGIKFSPGGGAPGTWTLEATNLAGSDIYRIAIDPDNSSQVYAATTKGLFRRPLAAPFSTWTQITSAAFTNANGRTSDVMIAGSGTNKVYYAAFHNDRVYSSPDAITWTALSGISAIGRTVLACGENDSTVVYALGANGSLFRLVGSVFQAVGGMPPLFNGGQGNYDLALGVDPGNANTVYLIGDLVWDTTDWSLSFFRGTITGSAGSFTFPFNAANAANPAADPTFIGRGVHADGHAFAFALNASGSAHDGTNVWVGNDGGVFRSTSSGANGTFIHRNTGLAVTEMTFVGQRPDTDSTLFGGAQDQGNLRFRAEEVCFESPEGDGGGVTIDPNNQYQVMRQYVRAGSFDASGNFNAGISTSNDGGSIWNGVRMPPWTANTAAQRTAVNNENFATGFYAPIEASPSGVVPTLAAFGTNRLWLSSDWGSSWVTLPTGTNPYVPATPNAAQDVLDGNSVTAIAFASGARIFAATRNAVWRFDNAAGWTSTAITTTGLPLGRFITSVAVDNAAAGSFYVALGGGGSNHCWYFDGTAWHAAGPNITALDIPCHAVVVDPANPNVIYLGSDVGCWKGTKTGATSWSWIPFSQGLPEAAITDLEIHARTRLLRAATHGRGVWEIQLDTSVGQDPDIYLRVNYADTGRIQGGSRFPWVDGAQDPTAPGFNVYHWMSADIKVRRPMLSGLPTISPQQDFLDFAVNVGDYVDSTTHIETADLPGTTDQIYVEVHNRGLTPLPGSQVTVLLLLADASAGLPSLPANYASHITAGDPNPSWLGSSWHFADPSNPYRALPGNVSARTPQIVRYDVDFSSLSLIPGDDHVCAAAFITTPNDPLTATNIVLDQLTMADKHVAHRNLHLVTATARPLPSPSRFQQTPRTFLIDFRNTDRRESVVDFLFQKPHFSGHMSVMLPKLDLVEGLQRSLTGFHAIEHSKLETEISIHLGHWLENMGEVVESVGEAIEAVAARMAREVIPADVHEIRVRRIAHLDRSRVFVAESASVAKISGVKLAPGAYMTAAVTVQAPPDSKPGDRFRFDIIQKSENRILGGSSYVFAVIKAR
jgi:hypothetical protein